MKDTKLWLSPIRWVKLIAALAVLSCSFLRVTGLGVSLHHVISARVIDGSDAQLIDAGRTVPVYRDLATFEDVVHLDPEKASDMARLQHISESDAIVYLPSGTRVRMLRATVQYAYVAIIDGEYAGARGYVLAALVQE